MKKVVVMTVIALGLIAGLQKSAMADWELMGNSLTVMSSSSYASTLTFDGATPYAAFYEFNASTKYTIWVKKYNGTDWDLVGNSLNVYANQNSRYPWIVIDGGTPYVAAEHQNGTAWFCYVQKYTGTAWEMVGSSLNSSATLNAFYPRIAFYSNTPYVSYYESTGPTWATRVKWFDGTDWIQYGSDISAGINPDIVFDGANPCVSYEEFNSTDSIYEIKVSKHNGTDWQQLGGVLNVETDQMAFQSDIEVFNGDLYVAFAQQGATNPRVIYIKRYNGTSWELVGTGLNVDISAQAYNPRLAASASHLYVSWHEGNLNTGKIYCKAYDGTSWSSIGDIVNYDDAQDAGWANIAQYNDQPYMTFTERYPSIFRVLVSEYIAPTATPTHTPTGTRTYTPTVTPTSSPTGTFTITPTWTPTASPTFTPTVTGTYTATSTFTDTPTATPTVTPTMSVSPTFTPTNSPTFTVTATSTITGTATITLTMTPTLSVTTTATMQGVAVSEITAYPNPAKDKMWFAYPLGEADQMEVTVYNMNGERITAIKQDKGVNSLAWQLGDVAPGIYVCHIVLSKEGKQLSKTSKKVAVIK